jgi:hypothetical protein
MQLSLEKDSSDERHLPLKLLLVALPPRTPKLRLVALAMTKRKARINARNNARTQLLFLSEDLCVIFLERLPNNILVQIGSTNSGYQT